MRKPVVRLKRQGQCHVGELDLPAKAGRVRVSMLGWSPEAALKRAGAAALTIALDPRMATILPPEAVIAARTLHALTTMSSEGLKETKAEATPGTAKVAAKILDSRRQYTGDVNAPIGAEIGAEIGVRVRDNRPGARGYNDPKKQRYMKKRTPAPGRGQGPGKTYGTIGPGTMAPAPFEGPRPYATPEPVDQYGNPMPVDQYGNPLPQQYGGGGQLSAEDAFALQAWGAHAYEAEAFGAQPEGEADQYFEGYEDGPQDEYEYPDQGLDEPEGDDEP